MPSEPKRKSWSYLPGTLAVEVDVEQLAGPKRLGDRVVEREADIVSCANSGLRPTMSGHSRRSMNASACPTVGSRMLPRGSLGLGSSAKRTS